MLEFTHEIVSKLRDRTYRIKDIVDATGISHGALKRIRDGDSVPKLETLSKLRSYFDGPGKPENEKLFEKLSENQKLSEKFSQKFSEKGEK